MRKYVFLILCLLCTFSIKLSAQSVEVSGTVWGYPLGGGEAERLSGVSVLESGTLNGTSTDVEGNFSLRISSPNAVLEFSYIGYITERLVARQIPGYPERMKVFLEDESLAQSNKSDDDGAYDASMREMKCILPE